MGLPDLDIDSTGCKCPQAESSTELYNPAVSSTFLQISDPDDIDTTSNPVFNITIEQETFGLGPYTVASQRFYELFGPPVSIS
jgi:hypothetical protein